MKKEESKGDDAKEKKGRKYEGKGKKGEERKVKEKEMREKRKDRWNDRKGKTETERPKIKRGGERIEKERIGSKGEKRVEKERKGRKGGEEKGKALEYMTRTLENITREYETQRVGSDRLIIWEWPLRLQRKRSIACCSPHRRSSTALMTQPAESRDWRGL